MDAVPNQTADAAGVNLHTCPLQTASGPITAGKGMYARSKQRSTDTAPETKP